MKQLFYQYTKLTVLVCKSRLETCLFSQAVFKQFFLVQDKIQGSRGIKCFGKIGYLNVVAPSTIMYSLHFGGGGMRGCLLSQKALFVFLALRFDQALIASLAGPPACTLQDFTLM